MALALLTAAAAAHHLQRSLSPPPRTRTNTTTRFFFLSPCSSPASSCCSLQRASSAGGVDGAGSSEAPGGTSIDADVLTRVSGATDADQALDIFVESVGLADSGSEAALNASDCNAIVAAALDRGNVDLALSVFEAMRSGFAQVRGWRWARPDVRTYGLLIQRLAAALRVSDAIRMIDYVASACVSSAEVPFGMIVRCPTCMVAVAVAQPQLGTQVVSCSKCRYQYELFSGDITSIESEDVSMDISAWEKALRSINVMNEGSPASVHSIVVVSLPNVA